MDTCNKVSKYLQSVNYECRVIGVPKTIDNDLYGTDHCPGYGSAAKYIATSTMEIYHDARVYDTGMITILEVMGRNAGWLTAATALATHFGCGPDLIYLPETAFDVDKFIDETKEIYKENKKVIVAVSEGARTKEGRYIAELSSSLTKDSFGHSQLGGTASILANLIKNETGAKVRGIEFSLLQRCAAHVASLTDINEAYMAGETAVLTAVEGKTDFMVAFERENGPEYKCNTKLLNLREVANTEKKIPLDWINSSENGLTMEFINYALPLIQGDSKPPIKNGLPRFAKLKKILAKV
jgi:6-phosphofructokinase 1